ncbi:uncharacterized protein BXZ73DRAFT_95602 [Epithele typhae]|uniref:uncharacterized protein n=1 Tax=Epithele typhae TaxID=378194 RepID=UPI0020083DC7|nr:uncharacterized protein BXZ73DRAFT_95602 [Epithele typhae]KAH9946098.1 hypothetical protein BXZ73DRAFT_95602 [Epithele typhae]
MPPSSSAEFEMDDLSPRRNTAPDGRTNPSLESHPTSPQDDGVVAAWAWVSAAIMLVVAFPLMFAPKLLLFLSETDAERRATLTPLESFLSWNTGLVLSALSLSLVMNIPSNPDDLTARRSTPGHPLLEPVSAVCVLISFLAYNTASVGSLGFLLCLGSGIVGLWGLWTIMFAGSSRISRTTGADKRTSAFIFGNKAAASVQKKQWKRENGR